MRSWCRAASASAASRARSRRCATRASNGVPYLGICLGMQVAIVEYGRHVLGLADANSTEFNRATPAPGDRADLGVAGPGARGADRAMRRPPRARTMRLGAQESRARRRHARARDLRHATSSWSGIATATSSTTPTWSASSTPACASPGFSRDGLVEVIELPNHPWFVATQFHPEFTSTPARRASAVHRLHPRRARASRRAAAAGGRRMKRPPRPRHVTDRARSRRPAAVLSDRRALRHREPRAHAGDRRPAEGAHRRACRCRSSSRPPTTRPTAPRRKPSAAPASTRA